MDMLIRQSYLLYILKTCVQMVGYQVQNKLKQVMIRANREVTADRRLFNNINRHLRPPQLIGEPDTPPQDASAEEIRMMLLELARVYSKLEAVFLDRIDRIQSKVQAISNNLHKIVGVLHAKKQKRLFSFANSPNSKDHNTAQEQKHKYSLGQAAHSFRVESPSNNKYAIQNTYIDGELSSLHQQIEELRDLVNHAHQPTGRIADYTLKFENSRMSSAQKNYPRGLSSPDWHTTASPHGTDQKQSSEIQRYKVIVAQYKKQDQILRVKADKTDKYKLALEQVVGWLKNLRENQLPAYLPCQAETIKERLQQIFKLNDQIAQDFRGNENLRKRSRQNDSKNDHEEMLMDAQFQEDEQ